MCFYSVINPAVIALSALLKSLMTDSRALNKMGWQWEQLSHKRQSFLLHYILRKCNSPDNDETSVSPFSSPRILRMEKLVWQLLETGPRTWHPLTGAERTRLSTKAIVELYWLLSIVANCWSWRYNYFTQTDWKWTRTQTFICPDNWLYQRTERAV